MSDTEFIEDLINTRYSQQRFVNGPEPIPGTQEIRVVLNRVLSDSKPFQSIVMPIHNQESVIVSNLSLVLENTTTYEYEFVFILDSCSDKSSETLLNGFKQPYFQHVSLVF
jgi:hypothetical protein